MADQYSSNFAIPGTSNIFQLIWKMTRTMKAAGWTVQASSDGVAKDTSGTQANDKWGGSVNPLSDVYVTNTNNLTDSTSGGWIVLRGPSTVKIPLSANPTGTLIRGETITQATSGAEGELIGYVWDAGGSSGWAAVLPHTGTFDASHVVTGSSSGATFTPTGTVVTYVREVVISRDTSSATNAKINGWIWYICADVSGESAQLATTLAASAGCTATVPPGAGGTGNTFPTKGILVAGTSLTGTVTGWLTNSTSAFVATSNGQIWAKNATPTTGVSADGSFGVVCSNTSAVNSVTFLAFVRLDDGEPGDIDPFVWWRFMNVASSTWNNSTNSGSTTASAVVGISTLGAPCFLGYQARGCPITTRDNPAFMNGTGLYYGGVGTASLFIGAGGTAVVRTINNHPGASPPPFREPVGVVNAGNAAITNSGPIYKGRCRWIQSINAGNCYDTYDSKTWLCLSPASANSPTILVPYDGTTTPIQ